mmetsp:Transcript_90073/g.159533  ORF Transcript_90073/g.159533 Transcript_90073/m.159533 type:complete len:130 (-) Transcript_90073:39-428(-)
MADAGAGGVKSSSASGEESAYSGWRPAVAGAGAGGDSAFSGASDGSTSAASSSVPGGSRGGAAPTTRSGEQPQGFPEARDEEAEEEEKFQESLNTFFLEFHRHIFNPVLFRLAALEIRKDLSDVPKGPF